MQEGGGYFAPECAVRRICANTGEALVTIISSHAHRAALTSSAAGANCCARHSFAGATSQFLGAADAFAARVAQDCNNK